MPWQREAEFREVLEKAVKKGSKGAIASTQAIALQDMGQCYKHVCALVERQMRKAKPAQRLNALYIISTICRHSLKKNKLQDKYTVRWGPNIADLVELLADLPNQAAQVEKVLASWKKEKIFPDAIVDQCAVSAGLELPPDPAAEAAVDATDAVKAGVPSPVLSIFSEPSAGSVDLDALDSFPPKTVASANTEAVRATEATSVPPANNASTGSSRPPIEPPREPTPPAELYDPFAAESYDYDPFGGSPPPAQTPHALPPLPSLTPAAHAAHTSDTSPALGGSKPQPGRQSSTGKATDARQPDLTVLANGRKPGGPGRTGGNALAPSVIKAAELAAAAPPGPPQPASASRKRKSRWEDTAPAGEPLAGAASQPTAATAVAAAAPIPPAASAAVTTAPTGSASTPAEVRSKPRRSRFSDAPPGPQAAPAAPATRQGSLLAAQEAPGTSQAADARQLGLQQTLPGAEHASQGVSISQMESSRSPDPPLPPAENQVLPPKPVTARQDGEAQAAAALEAVEQMLQAKRHSEARNFPPATSRPRQPPPPPPQQHQPPLPQPPPPQPPLPQQPPPQPTFPEEPHDSSAPAAPAWHAQHAAHAGHAVPSFGARPPIGVPPQHPFPHIAQQLQQGLQQGLHRPPHLGHLNPQHFVQAGLQQHHRPAPPHHLPSMLHQPLPPIQNMQHSSGPPQAKSPMPRQHSFGQGPLPPPAPPAKPPAPPAFKPQSAVSADLGHFQTTSVAMDTPTDTASIPTLQMRRSQQSSVSSKRLDASAADVQTPAPPSDSPDAPPPPPSPPTAIPAEVKDLHPKTQAEPSANLAADDAADDAAIVTVDGGKATVPELDIAVATTSGGKTEEIPSKTGSAEAALDEEMDMSE